MRQFLIAVAAVATIALIGFVPTAELGAQQQEEQAQERQQATDSIAGTIVEKDRNTLTVHTEDQQAMTFQVNQQTRILDETGQMMERREEDPLAELDPGEWVVVHYRTGEDPSEHIAVSIERQAENNRRDADAPQQDLQQQQQQNLQQQQQQQRQELERQNRDELPATSGALPLLGVLGLLALAAAGALGFAARREH